ncbi:MAG TPA: diacylglycerol kinase family protein [Patescibacteria group bacterium]|nr:diacylglycerol kinase family protein [Patescibacteria group bacterium]
MYCYIYDIFTNQKKYEKQLLKIELLLADLGIAGKTYKLNVLKNLEGVIAEAVNEGIKTIVAVGNDQTVSKIVNLIIDQGLTLGIIPVGENNLLATSLGIKSSEEAGQILAARKIGRLDVGKINDQYFLLGLESGDSNIVFDLKDYNIQPRDNNGAVGLYNINISNYEFRADPEDGIMEAVFAPKKQVWWQNIWHKEGAKPERISVFPVRGLIINHQKKPITINVDRQRTIKTPAVVEVLKNKLRVIIGKEKSN